MILHLDLTIVDQKAFLQLPWSARLMLMAMIAPLEFTTPFAWPANSYFPVLLPTLTRV